MGSLRKMKSGEWSSIKCFRENFELGKPSMFQVRDEKFAVGLWEASNIKFELSEPVSLRFKVLFDQDMNQYIN